MTKEISDLKFPEDVRYTDDHEWAKQEGDIIKVGISDYAQDQLGDIVFAELPEVGETFDKGAEFGTLESVKAVSELYLPVSGEIISVNEAIADAPELVNTDPYGRWLDGDRQTEQCRRTGCFDGQGGLHCHAERIMIMRYLPHTSEDIAAMLKVVGADSLDGLFQHHPR
jgi:glycine cleavage system H protein